MRTYLRLKYKHPERLPAQFRNEELRYPDELVAFWLERLTHTGAHVLDPFAGYGTTVRVAELLGRTAYGIEADAQRVAYIRARVAHPDRLIHGDARLLPTYALPPIDCVITSPPYMARHERENPLRQTESDVAYQEYLDDLRAIFAHVAVLLRPGGHVVLEVANLKDAQYGVTTLAWDVGYALSTVLRFEGETIVTWDRVAYGYDHSYCLLFRR